MHPSHELLINLAQRFALRDFVETGTCGGDTLRAVQGAFDRMFSIEIRGINPELQADFAGTDKLWLFHGSSGELLADILQQHTVTRALFWLDAHANDKPDQIPAELAAIEQHAPESLVVVDDITDEGPRGIICNIDSRLGFPGFPFIAPDGWHVSYRLDRRAAILHRGGYSL